MDIISVMQWVIKGAILFAGFAALYKSYENPNSAILREIARLFLIVVLSIHLMIGEKIAVSTGMMPWIYQDTFTTLAKQGIRLPLSFFLVVALLFRFGGGAWIIRTIAQKYTQSTLKGKISPAFASLIVLVVTFLPIIWWGAYYNLLTGETAGTSLLNLIQSSVNAMFSGGAEATSTSP